MANLSDDGNQNVLGELASIQSRLTVLEGQMRILMVEDRKVPPPPPREAFWMPESEPRRAVFATPPAVAQVEMAPPSPVAGSRESEADLEYFLATKVGLKLGAVLLCAGIGYLVSLAVGRGWITATMLFAGCCIVCLGFVVAGLIKRNEKEEFGQILVAVGSCGSYLTFAGGQVYQNLYSGETLVALFIAVSLANLGFAFWRGSRSFLGIGLVGGLSGALMPLKEGHVALNLVLHFLILVPAALIAARHRWPTASIWLYLTGSVALIPALSHGSPQNWISQVVALDLTAVVTTFVYTWIFRPIELDPDGAAAAIGIALTGLASDVYVRQRIGADSSSPWPALGLAAVCLAISALLPKNPARPFFQIGAAVCALLIAPSDLPPIVGLLVYAAIATICAASSTRYYARPLAALSVCAAALAMLTYAPGIVARGLLMTSPPTTDLACALAIAIGVGGAGYAVGRAWEGISLPASTISVVIVGLYLGRVGTVAMHRLLPNCPQDVSAATTFSLLAAAVALAVRLPKFRIAIDPSSAAVLCVIGVAFYSDYLSQVKCPLWMETVCLLAMAASVTAVTRAFGRKKFVICLAMLLEWGIGSHLGTLYFPHYTNAALTLSWIAMAAIFYAVGFAKDIPEFRFGCFFLVAATAAKIALVDLADLDPFLKVVVLIVLGSAILAGAYGYIRRRPGQIKG